MTKIIFFFFDKLLIIQILHKHKHKVGGCKYINWSTPFNSLDSCVTKKERTAANGGVEIKTRPSPFAVVRGFPRSLLSP